MEVHEKILFDAKLSTLKNAYLIATYIENTQILLWKLEYVNIVYFSYTYISIHGDISIFRFTLNERYPIWVHIHDMNQTGNYEAGEKETIRISNIQLIHILKWEIYVDHSPYS